MADTQTHDQYSMTNTVAMPYGCNLIGCKSADLHANADRPVAHVGSACRLHWVVVDVNNLVQVLGDLLCDLPELGKVKIPASAADGGTAWQSVKFEKDRRKCKRTNCELKHNRRRSCQ